MTINAELQSLYSSKKLIKYIYQEFNYKTRFGIDSAYNNHIIESDNQIIIKFPEEINLITNIKIIGAEYKLVNNNVEIKLDIINLKKYNNLRLIIFDIDDINKLLIMWDIYLIKNNLLSAL